MDDLPSLGRYVWAHATHKWLMADIPTMASYVQLRCKGKSTIAWYLKRCVGILNIWFYELTCCCTRPYFNPIPA